MTKGGAYLLVTICAIITWLILPGLVARQMAMLQVSTDPLTYLDAFKYVAAVWAIFVLGIKFQN